MAHNRPHTPEARAKISAAMKGKRNRLGTKHTEEAKERIARSVRRYHVLKREGLL